MNDKQVDQSAGYAALPVGVMDSGVGGISVLAQAVKMLPNEQFIYYGDTANAPYGTKSLQEIRRLVDSAVDVLVDQGIKALLVACNTATSAAITLLRERLDIPVIGMEPALKPASKLSHGGKVLVLATPATLKLSKFQALMDNYGQNALPVACPGLMEWVEKGIFDGPELDAFLHTLLKEPLALAVDAVVLGCTHYWFLKPVIERLFPNVPCVDGNHGTVLQLKRLLDMRGGLRADSPGSVVFSSSAPGDAPLLLMQRLYEHAMRASQAH